MCKGNTWTFVQNAHKSLELAVADNLELEGEDVRAVVDVGRGGRIASLVIRGRELLVPSYDDEDRSIRWGSFLMAPWPGRLVDGRLHPSWGSLDRSAPATDPGQPVHPIQLPRNHGRHAIHGVVFDRPWRVEAVGTDACALSIELDRSRWPFGGRVRQRLALVGRRLEISAEVEADEPMPAALGWHPWFRRALRPESDPRGVRLRLRADGIVERDGMVPMGRVRSIGGAAALADGPELGRRRLDDAFVGVTEPPVIDWPGLRLTLEIGPPLSVVTVYTPREALCVEPQTAWPNALGLPRPAGLAAGVVLVEPGRPLRVAWSMRWH
jgi:aldose 1-epimerase